MNFNEIEQFFDVITNPTKYKSVMDNLVSQQNQLKDLIKEAKVVGSLTEIQDQIEKATVRLAEMQEAAEAKAKSTLDKAKAEAESMMQAAETAKVEAAKDADTASKMKKAYDGKMKELAALDKEIKVRLEGVAAMEADVQARQQELTERLTKLKSVMV